MNKQQFKYIFGFMLLTASTIAIFYFSKPEKHNDLNETPTIQTQESSNEIIPKEDSDEEQVANQPIATFHVPKEIFELNNSSDEKTTLNFKVPERRVVFYWASWCEPCREIVKELNNISNDYPNVNFYTIMGVDGEQETTETAKKAINDLNITIPTYFDEGLALHGASQLRQYPAIAIQNQKGETLYHYQGGFDLEAVKASLSAANQ